MNELPNNLTYTDNPSTTLRGGGGKNNNESHTVLFTSNAGNSESDVILNEGRCRYTYNSTLYQPQWSYSQSRTPPALRSYINKLYKWADCEVESKYYLLQNSFGFMFVYISKHWKNKFHQ